jgi:uncharacterized protein with HEPN domain
MPSAKLPEVRLAHILQQIDIVTNAVQDVTAESLRSNIVLSLAIERSVQIVSEAAKELPLELRNRYKDVHWQAIIGIGNLLRHEYYRINSADIWDIATVHFPTLRLVVVQMLADLGPNA